MSALVATILLGTAVLLCFPPAVWPRLPVRSPLLLVPCGPIVLAVVVGLPSQRCVLLVLVLGSLADLARRFRRRRRRASGLARADRLLEACEGIAADLQVGLPPLRALEGAAAEWPDLLPVLHAARWGADVPDAWRELGLLPGADQARVVAASWQVAHRSGAGLAPALSLAAATLREDRATASVVQTELAGARATAALLALLPVGVLVLGTGAGGDPVGFLVSSGPGLLCLGLGLLLVHLGLAWLDAIADGILG